MILISNNTDAGTVVSTGSGSLPFGYAVSVPQSSGGSASASTFYDSALTITTAASTYNNWQIAAGFGVMLQNDSPAVATLSADGYLTRMTDGVARIKCVSGEIFSRLDLRMTQDGGATATTFAGYTAGTVSAALADAMTALWDAGGTLPIYSTINHASSIYTKSATFWADGYDLSGLSVGLAVDSVNFSQANAPSIITEQHGVIVRHFQTVEVGVSKVRCHGNDGVIYERTIIGKSAPMKTGGSDDDLIVVTFNAAWPAAVVPFAVAGDWIRQGVASTGGPPQTPGFFYAGGYGFAVNQNYQAVAVTLGYSRELANSFVLSGVTYNGDAISTIVGSMHINSGAAARYSVFDQLEDYQDFLVSIITGDSGKPTFVDVAGEPVLVALFTTANLGPLIGVQDGDVVNALIVNADSNAGISTGYTVTVAPDPTL